MKTEEAIKTLKSGAQEGLCEDISEVVRAGSSGNADGAVVGVLMDVMETNVNILAPRVVGWIIGQEHGAIVVAKKNRGLVDEEEKFTEEEVEPNSLTTGFADGDILGIASGAGNGLLFLGGPGEDSTTEGKAVVHEETAGVEAVSIRGVREPEQVNAGVTTKDQTEFAHAPEVMEDMKDSVPVGASVAVEELHEL